MEGNDIGVSYTTEDLGKSMPAMLPKVITVEEFSKAFYALETCDVWTADGWLVTAVQNDGVTYHLRKGIHRMRRIMKPTERLGYRPTAAAIAKGY